jgi:hypothetical protein
MAIDTREKRFSMLNFGDGTHIHATFEADGTVDKDDRQHLLDCYSGISFAAPGGGRIIIRLVGPGGLVSDGGLGGRRGGLAA